MPASIDPERLSGDTSPSDDGHTPQKQRGPVMLRRSQVQQTTTDQRLLDSRGPSDWVHSDPWRIETAHQTVDSRSAGQGLGGALTSAPTTASPSHSWRRD